jgi:hypothetical protein
VPNSIATKATTTVKSAASMYRELLVSALTLLQPRQSTRTTR